MKKTILLTLLIVTVYLLHQDFWNWKKIEPLVLEASIRLRNPYIDPLHFLQIRFLDLWRRTPEDKRTEQHRRLLALTVNGIAFGMKSTG